jgi:hypothetical protein
MNFTSMADEQDYSVDMTPSRVLVRIVGDEHGWSVEETHVDGGCAAEEACHGGFLDYIVRDMIEKPADGWWVIDGFSVSFSTDYYGESDADYDNTGVRRARISDWVEVVGTGSWWIRASIFLGYDPAIPDSWRA